MARVNCRSYAHLTSDFRGRRLIPSRLGSRAFPGLILEWSADFDSVIQSRPEVPMSDDTEYTRSERLALLTTALRGLAAGIARAAASWLLDQIHT